jgi:hypothetical protein
MTTNIITVDATLNADGMTLQLEKKISLPPGRVMVTVQSTGPRPGPTMLEVLDRIHQDQQQRGRRPMTEEEMAAEISQKGADDLEYEERWRTIWSQTGKSDKFEPANLIS